MQKSENLFLSVFKNSGFKQLSLLNICERCSRESDLSTAALMQLFHNAVLEGFISFDSKNQIVYLRQQNEV